MSVVKVLSSADAAPTSGDAVTGAVGVKPPSFARREKLREATAARRQVPGAGGVERVRPAVAASRLGGESLTVLMAQALLAAYRAAPTSAQFADDAPDEEAALLGRLLRLGVHSEAALLGAESLAALLPFTPLPVRRPCRVLGRAPFLFPGSSSVPHPGPCAHSRRRRRTRRSARSCPPRSARSTCGTAQDRRAGPMSVSFCA